MRRRILSDRSKFGESSSSSIVRMSNEAMWLTQLKNEHERWRYNKLMKELLTSEKIVKHHTERELEALKDDYLKMIAYGSVYKEHSFGKYDSSGSEDIFTLPHCHDIKPVSTQNQSKVDYSKPNKASHALPVICNNNNESLKQQEDSKRKTSPWARLKSPTYRSRIPSGTSTDIASRPRSKLLSCSEVEVNDSNKSPRSKSPSVANSEEKYVRNSNSSPRPKSVSWTEPLTSNEDGESKSSSSPRPKLLSVTDQLMSEIPSPSLPIKECDDLVDEQTFNVPNSPTKQEIHDEDEETEEDKRTKMALMSALAIKLHALIMWRQKLSNPKLDKPASAKQKVRRKLSEPPKSQVREKPHNLFPGDCKTAWAMKKFMEKEADTKLSMLNSAPKRNRAKLDKLIEKAKLPDLIDRGKSTSAIFRDFRLYKDSQKDENTCTMKDDQAAEAIPKPLLYAEDTCNEC